MKTIDVTPKWAEIVNVWLRIAREAYREDNGQNIHNFESEMRRMAETADLWNAYAKENIPVDDGGKA